MKFIDYVIAAMLVGCMFVGYSGHRLVALLLLALVAIVASWRFWDHRRANEDRTGGSGELNPEHDSATHDGYTGGDADGD